MYIYTKYTSGQPETKRKKGKLIQWAHKFFFKIYLYLIYLYQDVN